MGIISADELVDCTLRHGWLQLVVFLALGLESLPLVKLPCSLDHRLRRELWTLGQMTETCRLSRIDSHALGRRTLPRFGPSSTPYPPWHTRFMEIPEAVRGLLWEYDLDAAAPDEQWQQAVIERVMQRGTWEQMRWLARSFDRGVLVSFLRDRGRRALAPRELRFWLTMTGVDPATGDTWVDEARAREQAWRG